MYLRYKNPPAPAAANQHATRCTATLALRPALPHVLLTVTAALAYVPRAEQSTHATRTAQQAQHTRDTATTRGRALPKHRASHLIHANNAFNYYS